MTLGLPYKEHSALATKCTAQLKHSVMSRYQIVDVAHQSNVFLDTQIQVGEKQDFIYS